MPLSAYYRFAYQVFGTSVEDQARSNTHLRRTLQQAQMQVRPEVYLAVAYMNMVATFGAGMLLVASLAILDALAIVQLPLLVFVFFIPLPFVLSAIVYLITFLIPDVIAGNRGRDIEAKLPYALNYVATMAQAGMTPDRIFESLSQQEVYGEVAKEAAMITRDVNVLGRDLVTALNEAVDRSPSVRWQDLLQGAIATLTSGGDLKEYFISKSEQFMSENRQAQTRALDDLGVLAESFVTVVVAAPLFLIVLFTITSAFGGGGSTSLASGYLLIAVLLPLAHLGFAVTIKATVPEV